MHEVLLMRGCPSAAEGLNRGLQAARNEVVVCLHQDVFLPRGWDRRFLQQWQAVQRTLGPVGVAGVYGVRCRGGTLRRGGHVVDRERLLREPLPLPHPADTLDELLLAVPRATGLRFDPALGFHFYGADLCLQARQRGLAAVIVDALCFHNSRSVGVPPEFWASGERFASKWADQLPLGTSCAWIDRGGIRLV